MAHDLAQTAWRGAPRPLPDTLATMTPQAYNSIQYDAEKREAMPLVPHTAAIAIEPLINRLRSIPESESFWCCEWSRAGRFQRQESAYL